ncbi:hypothetical protein IJH97_00875 [Candidatus Saccharibacteria bacterium]|nr:hypothetical protein [Candidatus Saccharibacteria bacterium]
MASIVPTILTGDLNTYKAQALAYSKFSHRLQIDVMDGTFTGTATVPVEQLAFPEGTEMDLHMMVLKPSEHLPRIFQLKPSLVILHAESGENLLPVFQQLKAQGIKCGVALLKTTYPGNVKPYIDAADYVLLFAGALGKQGGTADLLQIEKVKLVRAIKQDVEIGWDGGANMSNIRAIAHSDIDVINVGSAISQAQDPAAAYQQLVQEADQRGVRLA